MFSLDAKHHYPALTRGWSHCSVLVRRAIAQLFISYLEGLWVGAAGSDAGEKGDQRGKNRTQEKKEKDGRPSCSGY